MAVSNLVAASTASAPILQRTLTSGSSVSDLPTGKEITAFIIGGGGGGGAQSNPGTTQGGGGGGGSGSICQYVFTLPTSRTISYTVGAGGSGAVFNGANGGNGGTTTFDGISAFPGLGAGSGVPGYSGHGGGGGGAGGGNSASAGGTGGAYGWKGQQRANTGSYGGYPGAGRSADLLLDNGPFIGALAQNTTGTAIIWNLSNPILPQYGDMIGIDARLSGSTSFGYTNTGYQQYGGATTKLQSFSSYNGSDLVVNMDYSTGPAPGANNAVIPNAYTYPIWASPFSKLTRLDWLRAAGISIPGGGGGGGGGGGSSSGGAGAGSGGNGSNGVSSGTPNAGNAGSVPGGGGGGCGGSGSAASGNSGGTGGAGAIYLFWAS